MEDGTYVSMVDSAVVTDDVKDHDVSGVGPAFTAPIHAWGRFHLAPLV